MKNALSRRRFIFAAGAAGAAVLATRAIDVAAGDVPMVDPAGPQATALGYVDDVTKVDAAKFARYEAGQHCANCQLYQGAADAESGPCLLFPGQAVSATGWCNSYAKKTS